MDRRFLITGSSGFIGRNLVLSLAENPNNYIFAYDRTSIGYKHPNIHEVGVDLKTVETFPEVDYVIHLAAFNGTEHFYTKSFEVIKDNIIPTLNILEYYKDRDIKRFIYAGTPESTVVSTEYFDYKIPTDEKAPIGVPNVKNKRWSYANSKGLGEQAVICSGLPYTIIRYNNIYGPKQVDHFVNDFIVRTYLGDYSLYGYENTRTFMYISDAIKATELLIEEDKAENEIVNVGGEEEITILDTAKIILSLMNRKDKELNLYDAPEGSTMRRCPDITKLKTLTNWKPEISLKEGLLKTIQAIS